MKEKSDLLNFKQLSKQRKNKKKYSLLLFVVLAIAAVAVILKCSGFISVEGDEEEGDKIETTEWEPCSQEEVLEVTPENSPDNPKFIKVSFTEDDYKNSPTYSEKIFRDSLTVADFKKEGVRVSIDSYNLHNEADEVKVQVLPKKKDPTYGNELYTYNISLASGQHEFGTEVQVTLPIHNGKEAVRNVLWHNPKTGEWEEVYYTMAEDGKSCTAYVDHFSDLSVEEMTLDDLQKMGKKLIDVYDNGSIFVELDANVSGRAMLPVTIVPTPAFEKIARRQTEAAKGLVEILKKGGGLPMDEPLKRTLDVFGFVSDATSSAITLGQLLQVVGSGLSYDVTGGALTTFGGILLAVRLIDEHRRGVDPLKSADDNFWSYVSLKFGIEGIIATIAGVPSYATLCGIACMGVFIWSTTSTVHDFWTDAICPFGTPQTIEEGAYHEYLRTPNTEVLKKLDINSDVALKGTGEGWAEALKAIFKENKGILNAEKLGDKIIELYDTYINYFWDELDPQTKRLLWREYINTAAFEWGTPRFSSPNLPSDSSEKARLTNILEIADMISYGFDGSYRPTTMSDEAFSSVWHRICYDAERIRKDIKDYKHRALLAVAKHTNPIIAKLIEEEQHNNIMDAKRLLRNEVLPLMNTPLLFHAKDMQLESKDPIYHSVYYGYNPDTKEPNRKLLSSWEFSCDKKPLFEANYYEGTFYCLDLKANGYFDDLGKFNVFHYLQYKAPEYVKITPAKETKLKEITGKVDFADKGPYVAKGRHGMVVERGFRIPIKFNEKPDTTKRQALSKLVGFWVPLEYMGKYRNLYEKVLLFSYLEEEGKFYYYEGTAQLVTSNSLWTEIKTFSYNEKTGVLTIDFKLNNPDGQGNATFYVNDKDNLVMKNHSGTKEFFRLTDENWEKNKKLMEEEEKKVMEKLKSQEYHYPTSIIPPGDTDY